MNSNPVIKRVFTIPRYEILRSGQAWCAGQHLEWDEAVITSVATNKKQTTNNERTTNNYLIIEALQILFGPNGSTLWNLEIGNLPSHQRDLMSPLWYHVLLSPNWWIFRSLSFSWNIKEANDNMAKWVWQGPSPRQPSTASTCMASCLYDQLIV